MTPDQHFEGALERDADDSLGTGSGANQMMRELVGASIKFGIGQALVLEYGGDGIGVRATCASNRSGNVASCG